MLLCCVFLSVFLCVPTSLFVMYVFILGVIIANYCVIIANYRAVFILLSYYFVMFLLNIIYFIILYCVKALAISGH